MAEQNSHASQDESCEGPRAGAAGEQRLTLPLHKTAGKAGARELQPQSPTFNPKAVGEVIDAMRQYDSAVPQLRRSSGDAAFHSRVLLPGEPSLQRLTAASQASVPRTTITVANEGDSVRPDDTEVQPGEMPIALGPVG